MIRSVKLTSWRLRAITRLGHALTAPFHDGAQLRTVASDGDQLARGIPGRRAKRRRHGVEPVGVRGVAYQREQRLAQRRLDQVLDQLTAGRARLRVAALEPAMD